MPPDVPATSLFAIRHWEDGVVVFDRKLGATHALDIVTGQVFCGTLATLKPSDADLLQSVRSLRPDADEADLVAAVVQAHSRLVAAGLLAVD